MLYALVPLPWQQKARQDVRQGVTESSVRKRQFGETPKGHHGQRGAVSRAKEALEGSTRSNRGFRSRGRPRRVPSQETCTGKTLLYSGRPAIDKRTLCLYPSAFVVNDLAFSFTLARFRKRARFLSPLELFLWGIKRILRLFSDSAERCGPP